jgi:hypothetical protein
LIYRGYLFSNCGVKKRRVRWSEKRNSKSGAESKFWNDRCAAVGAIMDAMDGFGSATGMTKEQRLNFEITHNEFWQNGGLDMAYQEYLERDYWEKPFRYGVKNS